MSSKSYDLFQGNNDTNLVHIENKPSDCTVELPQMLYINGSWECAFCDLKYEPVREYNSINYFYVCLDICQYSIKGKSKVCWFF